MQDNFAAVQKNLSGSNMRTGFACLFTGGPGTGKTETALQIARKTGRDLMQVDIAESKSMWFGESEKRIKEIFSKYRSLSKKSKITPILLFNEADAIISKRQNLGESKNGPGQTENAIQNIILQEIETLDGILIATTNLAQNMDKAFERRFLYKIEFEEPELETRSAIWKLMFPHLSDQDIHSLASQFTLSGGKIENIARRNTVRTILSGSPMDVTELISVCKEETAQNTAKHIGFAV
jgi:SpoVK/Ycf46/Vps4 family AAA+-type ATPase